jgi:hypothetical protein
MSTDVIVMKAMNVVFLCVIMIRSVDLASSSVCCSFFEISFY